MVSLFCAARGLSYRASAGWRATSLCDSFAERFLLRNVHSLVADGHLIWTRGLHYFMKTSKNRFCEQPARSGLALSTVEARRVRGHPLALTTFREKVIVTRSQVANHSNVLHFAGRLFPFCKL